MDTFINAIYLYDDKVLITFNYKEGTETVAFGEAVKAEKSSDMSARGAPNFERQIVRFGVLFYAGKRLHTFCTPFAHLPESGAFLRKVCTTCFPLHKNGTCRGEAPPSRCARPFCRLKAPLGLSLLRCASQTRTFENTPLSAGCKKKRGKLWQKERTGQLVLLICFLPAVPDRVSAPHPPARRSFRQQSCTCHPERPDLLLPGTR